MKYVLFFFNFILFVCGSIILGVGIWLKVDPDVTRYVDLAGHAADPSTFSASVFVLIAVGTCIFVLGFLGCCGACQESECLLTTYAFLMIVIVLLELVAAILVIVFKGKVKPAVENFLGEKINEEFNNQKNDTFSRAINLMQIEFKCCGGSGINDYENSLFKNSTGDDVPKSCCVDAIITKDGKVEINSIANTYAACKSDAKNKLKTDKHVYSKGCWEGFRKYLQKRTTVVMAVAFGVAGFQILAIIFACCVKGKIGY